MSNKIYFMSQSKAALSAMPWDITVLRIVHKIDGKISIHRIAEEADVRQIFKVPTCLFLPLLQSLLCISLSVCLFCVID